MCRPLVAVAGVLLVPLAYAQAQQTADGTLLRAPDHVLVWSQRAGAAERIMGDIGFTV